MNRMAVWTVGALMVLATPVGVLAMGNKSESQEAQRAKEQLQQRQEQARREHEALQAQMKQEKEAAEARAKAQQAQIEAKAKEAEAKAKEQAELNQVKTEGRQAEIEQQAQQKSEQIEGQVDQAKERLQTAERDAAQDQRNEISGTVASVNPDAHTLAIREDTSAWPGMQAPAPSAPPMQLKLDESITIFHAGQRLSVQDLKAGDKVKLQLQGDPGQRTVHTIVINQRAPGG